MNRARAAAARAKMHEAIDELFAALEEDGEPSEESVEDRPSRTRAKRVRRQPQLVRPPGEASPAIQARAERALRERGFR